MNVGLLQRRAADDSEVGLGFDPFRIAYEGDHCVALREQFGDDVLASPPDGAEEEEMHGFRTKDPVLEFAKI